MLGITRCAVYIVVREQACPWQGGVLGCQEASKLQ